MIAIRRADPGDRAALYELLTSSWLENWAPHLTPDAIAHFHAEDPVGGYLDACLMSIDVALTSDELAGMAHIEGSMLHAIHVARAAQGQGVGAALLNHAQELGARQLEVRAFNRRARNFYLSRGWRENHRYQATEMGEPVETIEMVR